MPQSTVKIKVQKVRFFSISTKQVKINTFFLPYSYIHIVFWFYFHCKNKTSSTFTSGGRIKKTNYHAQSA